VITEICNYRQCADDASTAVCEHAAYRATLSFGEVTVHLKCYICSYTQSMKLAGKSLLPYTACEHLSCLRETLLLSLLHEQPGLSMELHPALAQQVITVILC